MVGNSMKNGKERKNPTCTIVKSILITHYKILRDEGLKKYLLYSYYYRKKQMIELIRKISSQSEIIILFKKTFSKKKAEDISKEYNESYYDYLISVELESSLDFGKILIKHFNPSSVIDIGCGCGIYLKVFSDLGIKDLVGYDGSENAVKKSLLPGKIKIHDLRNPIRLNRRYDLCICIEVAEHIENKYSNQLIKTLTNLSDIIFFTAAPPGQGGIGHVNEQPFSFWINIFKKEGFNYMDSLTQRIREEMKAKYLISWVTKNMLIFKKI